MKGQIVVASLLLAGMMMTGTCQAQGVIASYAGSEWIFTGDNRPAREAPLGTMFGLAVDGGSTIFVADHENNMVFRMRADGVLLVVAGNGYRGYSGDEGQGRNASLNRPRGVAVDRSGNVYIADSENHRVRRVGTNGVITTIAGTGVAGFEGDGGAAVNARLNTPRALAFDAAGTLYIADSGNSRIRAIGTDGSIRTFAGNGQAASTGDGGPATSAAVRPDYGIVVDGGGQIFFSEWQGFRVRAITREGVIRTVAGNGVRDFARTGTAATQSPLRNPGGLALDRDGNLLITESNGYRLLRLNRDATLSVVAGNDQFEYTGDGGPATQASLGFPYGLGVLADGSVFVSDSLCRCVRRIDGSGVIQTVAGNGRFSRITDGTAATNAFLSDVRGLAFDQAGNLFVASLGLNYIGAISPDGAYRHVAGTVGGCCRDGQPAARALLNSPTALAFDAQGRLHIADPTFDVIRRINSDGTIATIAGTVGVTGFAGDGGPANRAQMNGPNGLAFDAAGNLYVADSLNRRIRRITPAGVISTIAGDGQNRYFGDGGPATAASFRRPFSLAITAGGDLLVGDLDDHRVRRIRANGTIETFAGMGRAGFEGDNGPATAALLSVPSGVAVDSAGSVYILERDGHRVRKVDAGGVITTVAGNGRRGFTGDGGPSVEASLNGPIMGIAVDGAGNVYIADSGNNRIRVVRQEVPSISAEPGAVTLSAREGDVSARATVRVSTDVPGLTYVVSTRTEGGSGWLRVTPGLGVAPGGVSITADASNLAAGRYAGIVELRSELATPRSIFVPVVFTVGAVLSPRFDVQPGSLTFTVPSGGGATQKLTVANGGGGALGYQARGVATGGNWLQVTPGQNTVFAGRPVEATVSVSAVGLAPGTYSGAVSFQGTEGQEQAVRVTLIVTERAQPKILLSQSGLTFVAVAEGGLPAPQSIGVLNQGAGSMGWTSRAVTLAGGDWLKLQQTSGQVDRPLLDVSFVEIGIDHQGLAPGEYYGRVEVAASSDNSPQVATVILKVLPAGSNPGPDVRPTGLVFTSLEGSNPGSQSVQVVNLKKDATRFASSRLTFDGSTWLSHSPTNASVAPSDPGRVVVQPEHDTLSPGVRFGAITLQFEDRSIRTVSVLSVVAPASAAASFKAGAERMLAGCPSNNLRMEYTALPEPFVGVVGEPTTIEVRVVDDCGTPLTPQTAPQAKVSAQFNNSDQTINLVHIGDGRWTGTWRPVNQTGSALVTVLALPGDFRSPAVGVQRSGVVQIGGRTPIVRAGSLRHSATFETDVPVAPGQLISVIGGNLADSESIVNTTPLPKEVNQTQVLLGGRALPLLFSSEGQINAQVPYDLPSNTEQQLYVRRGTTLSVPEKFIVAQAQPGIFTENQQGFGQGFIVKTDGTTLAKTGSPAARGEEVIIFCTGLGEVTPALESGVPAPNPAPRVVSPVRVTIGGVEATVRVAELTPGVTGRYQVRVAVPANAPLGDAVPVVVTVAGRSSQPATMSIR